MAQNEYDVNIKLNLEDSANSFSKRISEIDSELSKKQEKWRKEYQKSVQKEDLTDEARIYGQIRYVNQKQKRAYSYKRLEKERGSLVTAKEDSQNLLKQLNNIKGNETDTKTLDKLVESNLGTISHIVELGQKCGAEVESLEKTLNQVKAKREQLKSFEKMDIGSDSYKKKVAYSPKPKTKYPPLSQNGSKKADKNKKPYVFVPDDVIDKDTYRQSKELIEARKANNLKYGANKTLPAYDKTRKMIAESETRGHAKYTQEEAQQIFEMVMNEEELKKMVSSKPRGGAIEKGKAYLTRNGYGTFLPKDSTDIVPGGHYSQTEGLMPNESIKINAPKAWTKVSKLTGVDLGSNYGQASMFQVDEYYSQLQEGVEQLKTQLETASAKQKPLIEAKLKKLNEAAGIIVSTITEAINNTSVEEIKNKAISNATIRDNGMFGSDFDPDAPYAKTSLLMREIQGRFGTKPTDFEMELIDNNKPMQRQYEPEVVRKEDLSEAKEKSASIAEMETKAKETMEYLSGQFWTDFSKALNEHGAEGATELVNQILAQQKDALRGNVEESKDLHFGSEIGDIGRDNGEGTFNRQLEIPIYDDDKTGSGTELEAQAEEFQQESTQAEQKMTSSIKSFIEAILKVVDFEYENAMDSSSKVGLGKLKEKLEKNLGAFYNPDEKSIQQNYDESFNRAARLLTVGPMQVQNWQTYADKTGISFQQSVKRTTSAMEPDEKDEFLADVSESVKAYNRFKAVIKDDWSNLDEALNAALSADNKETREIIAQINSFKGDSQKWENWKSAFRQEMTPGVPSANIGGDTSQKVDKGMPIPLDAASYGKLSPKARNIQGHGLGQAVLGTFGTTDIEEGIKRGEERLKQLEDFVDKAEEKYSEAQATIERIQQEYGTHVTDKGTIVDFDLPLWADENASKKDVRKKTNIDINQYQKAQEIVDNQPGGQQEIDYVKALLAQLYDARDRRNLALATQNAKTVTVPEDLTGNSSTFLAPTDRAQDERNQEMAKQLGLLKEEEQQAKQTEQAVVEAENNKQGEIAQTTTEVEKQVESVKQQEEGSTTATIIPMEETVPTVQEPIEEVQNNIPDHVNSLQESIDKEKEKLAVSKDLTEQLIKESEAFKMVQESVLGEVEATNKAAEGETDWAKRVAEIKKELRDSAKAIEEKKAAEEKSNSKEESKSKPEEEDFTNPFTNFTDEELRNAGRVPLSGGEMVSYGGGKKESQLISKYLAEYQKRLNLGKEVNAIAYKINELSKNGTKASEQELANLKEQLDSKRKAYDAQVQYMEDNNLTKTVEQAGGQSQTRIGNVILSARGAENVKQKSTVLKENYLTSDSKNIRTADKARASEEKKALNNAIDRQKDYNALIQEEYELKRKIQGSSGDKQVEQQNRLTEVQQELQAYTNMSTKINENGQLIGQQVDKQKLLDQLAQSTYLTEQDRAKKEREINKLYSEQQAKLSRFKMQNAQSAGSNTVNTTQEINKYLKSLEQIGTLEREKARLQMKGGNLSGMAAIENRSLISNYDRQISGLQNQYSFKQLADGRTTLNGIELTEEEINHIEQERSKILDRNNAKMAQTQETVQQTKGFLEKLKDNFYQSFQQIGSYVMSLFSFQGIERAFSTVINRTSELDSKMVDLQIASGYTREGVSGMMFDFNKLGKQIGKTTSEIAEAANDWLRAGYDGAAASQLTQASMNLSTLGMINSADATSYLISVMKGWKLEANDIDKVVDKLTATDMAAAISAGDLAEAMSRANNSAQMAGSTLDRYIGYLTTITDVTQKSAASVGESMKTVDLCGFVA